jgi:hypothetical protein
MPTARGRERPDMPPEKETLAWYKNRVVRIRGEARSQRSMIEWTTDGSSTRSSAVKWKNLVPLQPQLF